MMGDAATVAELSYADYLALERSIEVYSRGASGVWELREAGEGESAPLSAFPDGLDVDRVYRGVTLTPAPVRTRG